MKMMKNKWLRLIEYLWRGGYQGKRRVSLRQKGFGTLGRTRRTRGKEESTMKRGKDGDDDDGGGGVGFGEW